MFRICPRGFSSLSAQLDTGRESPSLPETVRLRTSGLPLAPLIIAGGNGISALPRRSGGDSIALCSDGVLSGSWERTKGVGGSKSLRNPACRPCCKHTYTSTKSEVFPKSAENEPLPHPIAEPSARGQQCPAGAAHLTGTAARMVRNVSEHPAKDGPRQPHQLRAQVRPNANKC